MAAAKYKISVSLNNAPYRRVKGEFTTISAARDAGYAYLKQHGRNPGVDAYIIEPVRGSSR